MDIFALPDAFLRDVMKLIEIRDRKTLRLTCRAFEKLVAESNAGYYQRGYIERAIYDRDNPDYIRLKVQLDYEEFRYIEWAEVKNFIHTFDRLFSGITLGNLCVQLDDAAFDLEMVLEITKKFKILALRFELDSAAQVDKAVQMMSHHPESEHNWKLYCLPENEQLRSLPPLRRLMICDSQDPKRDSIEIFFELLSVHWGLRFELQQVHWTSENFKKALRILSAENRERRIFLLAERSSFIRLLNQNGVTENSKKGDRWGEFEVMYVSDSKENMHLRFKRCVMEISRFNWGNETGDVHVDISNCDRFH